MAGTTKKSSSSSDSLGSSSSDLTVIDAIRRIAHDNAFADINNERQLILFLKSWWSKTYNRPLKDPLLETYTVEELLYEFYDRLERDLAADTQVEQEADRIEDKKVQENLDWAEAEERKELEALRAKQAGKKSEEKAEPISPLDDPANKEWMQKQIEKDIAQAKETFGPDFGEDINDSFE